MNRRILIGAVAVAFVAVLAIQLQAQMRDHAGRGEHIMKSADEIEWQDGPASLPPGAQLVVLEGDPASEGMFTMRLKAPPGYKIPPHTHPRVERVTVLEGMFRLGMGREFNEDELNDLPAGSFFTMPPGMEHFAAACPDNGAVVQLTGQGPWGINYVNPADDPRNQ